MPVPTVEERLAAIEKELVEIKQQLQKENTESPLPWWEQIFGAFEDSEGYEEAMRLGREYRESLRPKDDEGVS